MKLSAVFTRCLVILFFIAPMAFPTTFQLSMDNMGLMHPPSENISFNPSFYDHNWYINDRNGDGDVDHAVSFDDEGYKLYEVMDFDNDGIMDDFYFYQRGVLVRQEIDQNGDQRIDLWVYITEGVYIEGYERDSDYDGRIDVVRLYGNE